MESSSGDERPTRVRGGKQGAGGASPPAAATPAAPAASESGLSFIADVPLRLTVEIGSTNMRVREVLALDRGSVVELDRQVGEPADVLVNGRLVARGEVTVVDEQIAIRVVEVVGAGAPGPSARPV